MTVPREYVAASRDFENFLIAARDSLGCETTHRAYAAVRAVLLVFRRRLSASDAVRFAGALPPLLRALFVDDWNMDEAVLPFGNRASLTRDVQAIRIDHNVAPGDAIAAVARAIAHHVDRGRFERVLATLSDAAQAYWNIEV